MIASLNKENIITVDIKNATVTTKGSMKFYATDIKTCNIFCELVVNESESKIVKRYNKVDNASDFTVTMRIVKPNNKDTKEIEFTLFEYTDEDGITNSIFYVDLTEEYKDYAGVYKCELFVDCMVRGELERITTSPFTYEVKKSIYSDLDEILDVDPSQPLLERLATIVYVDDSIAEIPETDLLKDYATRKHVSEMIIQQNNEIAKRDYASRQYVNDMINNIRYDIGVAGYATSISVNESISALRTDIIGMLTNNYASISYVDQKISEAQLGGGEGGSVDLSDYVTKDSLNNSLSNYATSSFVSSFFNECIDGRLEGYATELYVRNAISNIEISSGGVSQQEMVEHVSSRLQEYDETISTRYYATEGYVDRKISEAQLGGGEGGSVDLSQYATTEYVDGIIHVIDKAGTGENIFYDDFAGTGTYKLNGTLTFNGREIQFNNEIVYIRKVQVATFNRIYIYRFYTADRGIDGADYMMLDYSNGTMETKFIATESYVDNAIANIEIPETSGNNNCMLTIGNGSEEHIFSYDDIPDSMITDDPESFTQLTVLLKNVTVNYMDPNNYEQASKNYPDNIVTVIAMKPEEGVKAVGIVEFNAINGSREMMMFAVTPESIMLAEQFTDELATVNNVAAIYATKTELNNYADKTYVETSINSALGDIESLLEEI